MDPFDRELRERAKREPFPVPEDYARRRGMSDSEMQKLLGNLL